MITSSQVPNVLSDSRFSSAATHVERRFLPLRNFRFPQPATLFFPVVTTALAVHLLLVAFFGAGVPEMARLPSHKNAPPVTSTVFEAVKLESVPLPQEAPQKIERPLPNLEAPERAASLDVPKLEPVQAVAAVASTTAVAFGVEVKGPVRLVSDAANASSGSARRPRVQPIFLDTDDEARRSLLLPEIHYPPEAKRRHLTGLVTIEFRASAKGDIEDVSVRQSSGSHLLDHAATDNLRAGRWTGQPGFYVKAYEFSLR